MVHHNYPFLPPLSQQVEDINILKSGYRDIGPPPVQGPNIRIPFFLQLAEEAGIPPGVINCVTASRDGAGHVGKALCESPLVGIVSFTGSTRVGKVISFDCNSKLLVYKQCGPTLCPNALMYGFHTFPNLLKNLS